MHRAAEKIKQQDITDDILTRQLRAKLNTRKYWKTSSDIDNGLLLQKLLQENARKEEEARLEAQRPIRVSNKEMRRFLTSSKNKTLKKR